MAVGEPGELALAGPQVMPGYWNQPDETAQVLPDGWLLTGDMAVMDEEGYFSIVDRKKDLIIAGGYNVYPREVEEILCEHPKVLEVAVAGVPDSYRGEIVKAFVVLRSGEQATVEEIREFAMGRLAGYKVPRSVEFRDDLPKTLIGKVLRRALVEEEQARQARQTAESGAETAVRPAEQGPRTQAESRAESP
jgi:long-chain acyl-CoA synthetase